MAANSSQKSTLEAAPSSISHHILEKIAPAWCGQESNCRETICDPTAHRSVGAPLATLRVQAQRIYSRARISQALALPSGAQNVASLTATILAKFFAADGEPGFVTAIGANGQIVDQSRKFEDHAWILSALAQLYKLTRSAEVLLVVDILLEFIDARLSGGSHGYRENDQGSPFREQAAHLRLFDALLTLIECAAPGNSLARAKSLFELFHFHFIDRAHGRVYERFDDNWRPAPTSSPDRVRPGIAAQWIVQLQRYSAPVADARATSDINALANGVMASRNSLGFLPRSVALNEAGPAGSFLLRDQLNLSRALSATSRDFSQPLNGDGGLERQIQLRFLAPAPLGCWIERVSEDGLSVGDTPSLETLAILCDYASCRIADAALTGPDANSAWQAA